MTLYGTKIFGFQLSFTLNEYNIYLGFIDIMYLKLVEQT